MGVITCAGRTASRDWPCHDKEAPALLKTIVSTLVHTENAARWVGYNRTVCRSNRLDVVLFQGTRVLKHLCTTQCCTPAAEVLDPGICLHQQLGINSSESVASCWSVTRRLGLGKVGEAFDEQVPGGIYRRILPDVGAAT